MSNSIWHKSGLEVPATDNKAKISRGGDIIYWTPYGWSHPKSYNHHRIGCEWAYLEDVLAQADNAERLLEIAERQNDILQVHFATLGYSIGKEVMDMSEEIKQLIKE